MDRQNALTLARREIDTLGLNDWRLEIDARPTRRLGQTRYASRTIGISGKFVDLNTWDIVRITVRHESAHALVGPGYAHGPVWKRKAWELGVPASHQFRADNLVLPRGKFDIICPEHGRIGSRSRRPSDGRRFMHSACGSEVTFEHAS